MRCASPQNVYLPKKGRSVEKEGGEGVRLDTLRFEPIRLL